MENKNKKGAAPTAPKKEELLKRPDPKKQFNFYWIYGIMGVLLLGY